MGEFDIKKEIPVVIPSYEPDEKLIIPVSYTHLTLPTK